MTENNPHVDSATTVAFRHSRFACVQWIVLPLLVLGGLEYAARCSVNTTTSWYDRAAAVASNTHIDFLFIGSSRVAIAVNGSAFAAVVSEHQPKPARLLNLGMGSTTLPEHYLGVRNLLAEHPDSWRSTAVFLEAESGLSYPVHWDASWVNTDQPQVLLPLLRSRDLWGLWRSQMGLDLKSGLTLRFLTRPSMLVSHHERIREQLLRSGRQWFVRTITRWRSPTLTRDMPDLHAGGGIRADEGTVQEARRLASVYGSMRMQDQTPISSWQDSVQADLAKLLNAHGARLVFFAMPESSIFSAGYDTDVRRRDRNRFVEEAQRWGSAVLRPDFAFADDDFPDLWHLRQSRSVEFTTALARAWVAVK